MSYAARPGVLQHWGVSEALFLFVYALRVYRRAGQVIFWHLAS